ncbi:MFS transporter [Rhodococcus koreensis]
MTPQKTEITKQMWFRAGVSGMASYLDSAAIVSTGTALVLYQDTLGLTKGNIGALSSALTLSIALGALVGGRLGDKFGRRRVFTATVTLLAVGALVLASAPSVPVLCLGIVMLGFAAGADLPVSLALVAEQAPEGGKGKLVALSQVLWYCGIITTQFIGVVAGGLGVAGGRILYGHIAVVAVIVLLLRMRIPESKQWLAEHHRAESKTGDGVDVSALRQLFKLPYILPFISLGLFYSLINLAANTKGQFGTYMYVNVAHSTVQVASTISLVLQLVSIILAVTFMRLVDGPNRMRWYVVGAVCFTAYFTIPAVFGVSVWSLAIGNAIGTFGLAFSFEGIYKVWTQEKFPTLLRATSQGMTISFARVLAAVFALWTPMLLDLGPRVMFATLATVIAISTIIGYRVNRMPNALTPETDSESAVRAEAR